MVKIFNTLLVVGCCATNSFAEEPKKCDKCGSSSSVKSFVNKYIFPDENQIFKDKKHIVSLFGGYAWGNAVCSDYLKSRTYRGKTIYTYDTETNKGSIMKRQIGNIAISYGFPTKFGIFNGRLSIGIMFHYLQQNIAVILGNETYIKGNFYGFGAGFEIIQEVIFGHPNLYFTFGVGVAAFQNLSTRAITNNEEYNRILNEQTMLLWNNSCANFAYKMSIGHGFENGIVIELTWKHYSNGYLSEYNWGINYFGATIGYTF